MAWLGDVTRVGGLTSLTALHHRWLMLLLLSPSLFMPPDSMPASSLSELNFDLELELGVDIEPTMGD